MPIPCQEDYLLDLTPSQREAVLHMEGPLLILAGPGSGKTRVITRRVAHLIHQGVRPYQILAITFTNKAANEMRQRIEKILPGKGMWISTFHSFGVRILRQYADRLGLDRNFTIYDQADRVKVVRLALDAANIDNVRFTPDAIMGAISKAKNQLLLPHQYSRTAADFFTTVVAQVYEVYEKKLREVNALDFDDLLLWPALALKNDQEMRAELDARFRYILIDEYQDTNKAQYEIARGLAVDYPNLCVVGDPDQSIYKWRGSDIRNILDFERDFPDARVITLAENFRSTQSILEAADHLIAHNKKRKAKTLTTANPRGKPVQILQFENGLEEADQIAGRIRAEVEAGRRKYRDFAIFLRVNALSRTLETAFVRARVPYQIVRGLAFFDRKENKDILAYLRLLLNPKDDISFLRVVNEPARGIGKTSLEHLANYAQPRELNLSAALKELDKIPAIKAKAATALRNFDKLLAELRPLLESTPDVVIREVIERSGYSRMLRTSEDAEDADRLANIEELITAARQFWEEDHQRTPADFLENITLASDVDGWDDQQDNVSVMTLHAAKGLEFPVVYMAACEMGILPHERSLSHDEDLEEERRLAFVGVTRAQEELFLSYSRLREFRGQTLYAVPSLFLDELPREQVQCQDLSSSSRNRVADQWRGGSSSAFRAWQEETGIPLAMVKKETRNPTHAPPGPAQTFAPGVLVQHHVYGIGKITNVSGHGALRKLKIRFSSGERTFIADKAKLTIVPEE